VHIEYGLVVGIGGRHLNPISALLQSAKDPSYHKAVPDRVRAEADIEAARVQALRNAGDVTGCVKWSMRGAWRGRGKFKYKDVARRYTMAPPMYRMPISDSL
jgi:hypothetical protein